MCTSKQPANWCFFDCVGLRWQPCVYVSVKAKRVRHRAVAEATRRWAAHDLGIIAPRVRFFVPIELAATYGATHLAFASSHRVNGITYKGSGEVWIDARLPRRAMVEVVAHEVKHDAQWSGHSSDSDEQREAEARRYGRRVSRGQVARTDSAKRRPSCASSSGEPLVPRDPSSTD